MFYLIDKPLGISSFDVIRGLRKTLWVKKMGHTGTLDPLATGCLLIATENSTKLIPLLESAEKEYIATIDFSGKSDSYDRGTTIESVDATSFRWKADTEVCTFLLNLSSQIPPRYSAIHVDGVRAYEKALSWEDFTLPSRPIKIHEVEILKKDRFTVTLRLRVSAWCYIRSLAPVLWSWLGSPGGYLDSLRRTKIVTDSVILWEDLLSDIDIPVEIPYSKLFPTFHTYELDSSEYEDISIGKTIPYTKWGDLTEGKYFLTYENFMSLAEYRDGVFSVVRNRI